MTLFKALIAVVAGLATWLVVATIGNRLLRAGLAGYADVEAAMTFTLGMMIARLALGATASLAAGAMTARLSRAGSRAPLVAAVVLFVFFVPAHIALWSRFPWWYHATFLASLLVCTLLGAQWRSRSTASSTEDPGR